MPKGPTMEQHCTNTYLYNVQTPHRFAQILVLACTRDIDAWEAGAIWEAQRAQSLCDALGHGDRKDWRGVNREVGCSGDGLLAAGYL